MKPCSIGGYEESSDLDVVSSKANLEYESEDESDYAPLFPSDLEDVDVEELKAEMLRRAEDDDRTIDFLSKHEEQDFGNELCDVRAERFRGMLVKRFDLFANDVVDLQEDGVTKGF